ncbi:hypothetical protein [Candidatus Nitrosacidococcus sp. I8]|uniref:hypothetical protein n=1 Tax=Candidatus Nitrosacidococcus sp. I8 TaxID=2942908 RepID=UPI002227CB60|nr:hypothetical protein [Candidatus Nitrosacidococcus sp. I8]CAH9017960.1 hypothetical protein NURINAE_00649 [Candidatus Nitrosacidococcus sp. I8]
MKSILNFILSLLLCLPIIAFSATKMPQQEVAEKFWAAIKSDDEKSLAKYTAAQSIKEGEITSPLPSISNFKLDKGVTLEDDEAKIKTTITLIDEKTQKTTEIPTITVLIQEGRTWKVLYRESIGVVTEARELTNLLGNFQNLSDVFGKNLNDSVDKLQQSLPAMEEKLRTMREKLNTQMPEFKDRLNGITNELNKLFNDLQKNLQENPPTKKDI